MANFFHACKKKIAKGKAASHHDYVLGVGRHKKRTDVVASEQGNMPEGITPREFFSAADVHERANAAAAKEWIVALPNQLSNEEAGALASALARQIAGPKPWLLAVHKSEAALAGGLNSHMHLMLSDRVPDQVERPLEQVFHRFNRSRPEAGGWRKDTGALTKTELKEALKGERHGIATTINQHLENKGVDSRVDARSNRDRGLPEIPTKHLGAVGVRERKRALNAAADSLAEPDMNASAGGDSK